MKKIIAVLLVHIGYWLVFENYVFHSNDAVGILLFCAGPVFLLLVAAVPGFIKKSLQYRSKVFLSNTFFKSYIILSFLWVLGVSPLILSVKYKQGDSNYSCQTSFSNTNTSQIYDLLYARAIMSLKLNMKSDVEICVKTIGVQEIDSTEYTHRLDLWYEQLGTDGTFLFSCFCNDTVCTEGLTSVYYPNLSGLYDRRYENSIQFKRVHANEISITLPIFFEETNSLNKYALMQYWSIANGMNIIVLKDSKKSIQVKNGTDKTDIEFYRDYRLEYWKDKYNFISSSNIINGLIAEETDFVVVKNNRYSYYKVAFLESSENIYTVCIWTINNRDGCYKLFSRVINSFQLDK